MVLNEERGETDQRRRGRREEGREGEGGGKEREGGRLVMYSLASNVKSFFETKQFAMSEHVLECTLLGSLCCWCV